MHINRGIWACHSPYTMYIVLACIVFPCILCMNYDKNMPMISWSDYISKIDIQTILLATEVQFCLFCINRTFLGVVHNPANYVNLATCLYIVMINFIHFSRYLDINFVNITNVFINIIY